MSKQKTSKVNSGKKNVKAGNYVPFKRANGETGVKHMDAKAKLGEELPLTEGATWGFNLEIDQKCVKPVIRTIGSNPYVLVDQAFDVLDYAHKVGKSRNYVVAPINSTPQQ